MIIAMQASAQEEISTFKLTDVRGSLTGRYFFNESIDEYGGETVSANSNRWQEELYIRTRSYIYHPALLEMLISAGPVFSQTYNSSGDSKNDYNISEYKYDGRLNFLSRKPYPFTVYFSETYPETAVGLSGRFPTRRKLYAINGRIRQPLTPVNINWGASHLDANGSGLDATVDTSADTAFLNTSFSYMDGNNLQFNFNWDEDSSRNASPGLPTTVSMRETKSAHLTGDNKFGDDRQVSLTQQLNWRQQVSEGENASQVDRLAYTGNLRWRHSARRSSNGNVRYSDDKRGESRNIRRSINGGMNLSLDSGLRLRGAGRYEHSESQSVIRERTGVSVGASYRRTLSIGQLSLDGKVSTSRSDQQASQDSDEVFDEQVTLVALIPVDLQREFVVTNSVVVISSDRTVTFSEGFDYRLVTIGSITSIERVATGSILDGEEVLVSYQFLTGGTVEYGTVSQSIGANLKFSRHAFVFLRLANTENDVLTGEATNPLNDIRRVDFGANFDYPLFRSGWSIGTVVRLTEQDEDIAPFQRTNIDAYLQSARYWRARLRLGVTWETIEYELSPEEVDRIRYTMNIDAALPGGWRLGYRATYSDNDDGRIVSESHYHSLRLDWRYRRVIFSLDATQSNNAQDTSAREDTRISAYVRRYF
jgi:hypothetical protein